MRRVWECAVREPTRNGLFGPHNEPGSAWIFPAVGGIPVVPTAGQNRCATTQMICVCGGQPFKAETEYAISTTLRKDSPLYTYGEPSLDTGRTHVQRRCRGPFCEFRFRGQRHGNNCSAYVRAFGGETPLSQSGHRQHATSRDSRELPPRATTWQCGASRIFSAAL